MHSMWTASAAPGGLDSDDFVIDIELRALAGRLSVTVCPRDNLCRAAEVAHVIWHGPATVARVVRADTESDPRSRFFRFLLHVIDPDTAPEDFKAPQWSRATVTVPNSICPRRSVVVVERDSWVSWLSRGDSDARDRQFAVPQVLRHLDAGQVLFHVAARLLNIGR